MCEDFIPFQTNFNPGSEKKYTEIMEGNTEKNAVICEGTKSS